MKKFLFYYYVRIYFRVGFILNRRKLVSKASSTSKLLCERVIVGVRNFIVYFKLSYTNTLLRPG